MMSHVSDTRPDDTNIRLNEAWISRSVWSSDIFVDAVYIGTTATVSNSSKFVFYIQFMCIYVKLEFSYLLMQFTLAQKNKFELLMLKFILASLLGMSHVCAHMIGIY